MVTKFAYCAKTMTLYQPIRIWKHILLFCPCPSLTTVYRLCVHLSSSILCFQYMGFWLQGWIFGPRGHKKCSTLELCGLYFLTYSLFVKNAIKIGDFGNQKKSQFFLSLSHAIAKPIFGQHELAKDIS